MKNVPNSIRRRMAYEAGKTNKVRDLKDAYELAPDEVCSEGRKLPGVKCPCGWRGNAGRLLVVDENELMYCPNCHRHGYEGWEYV